MPPPDAAPESPVNPEIQSPSSPASPPTPAFKYDVFISYSSQDKEWVRRTLLPRLEKAGLKAFIDYRDFTRGAPSIKECQRGVEECRKILLVLTPNYVDSGWTEIENIMAQTLDPANRTLRMIPLLKAVCQKPLRIGSLTHIDFTPEADDDEQHTLAWKQLILALGGTEEPTTQATPERAGRDWLLAHPYAMAAHFTGRKAERFMLSGWLTEPDHPLLVLRALGGFGKSALTWHWLLKDVNPEAWPKVVWWSFYEKDASFEAFVKETLDYLTGSELDMKQLGGKNSVAALLKLLNRPGILLVLDGFERELRDFSSLTAAYQGDEEKDKDRGRECVSPLADDFLRKFATLPDIQSKVLLTTRLRPRILEAKGGTLLTGCYEEQLKQLQPADAVAFFQIMGIRGTRTEIETACANYGYHPLSLRLLAGLVVEDLHVPGDIAAARNLDVSGDLIQRQHHVLEASYNNLTLFRQAVLSGISCLRSLASHDIIEILVRELKKPQAIDLGFSFGEDDHALDADIRDLVARGLLNCTKVEPKHSHAQRVYFDLHPIVRRYAYNRLAIPARSALHIRLRDYFASRPKVDKVTRLEDLVPIIELYHHAVQAGRLDEGFAVFRDRLAHPLYFQLGANLLIIELLRALFSTGERQVFRLTNKSDQHWALNMLAVAYASTGQSLRAVPIYEQGNIICEKSGNKVDFATGLINVAIEQIAIGSLKSAEVNVRKSIGLGRDLKDKFKTAVGHQELGRLLACVGAYSKSATELTDALRLFEAGGELQGKAVIFGHRSLRGLLLRRGGAHLNPSSIIESALRSLNLADETAHQSHPYERDYVRAHWLLGAANRLAGAITKAEHHLGEALQRCRRINLVEIEADILIALARLRADTGDVEEVQRLAEEALSIADRCGYVMQGADAHLELAKLARARGEKDVALTHAQEARRLATCDGPPDYTYKAAYDEAGELLKELQV